MAAAKKSVSGARMAGRKAPAKKTASKPPPKASAESGSVAPAGLLRAGLQALGNVRDDVVKRQTNVIESLLGRGGDKTTGQSGAAKKSGFPSLDSFGIRKFEDVFDQRVATAMQRLGMPSADEIKALRDQMTLLIEHLERIERSESGPRKR